MASSGLKENFILTKYTYHGEYQNMCEDRGRHWCQAPFLQTWWSHVWFCVVKACLWCKITSSLSTTRSYTNRIRNLHLHLPPCLWWHCLKCSMHYFAVLVSTFSPGQDITYALMITWTHKCKIQLPFWIDVWTWYYLWCWRYLLNALCLYSMLYKCF